MISNETKVSFLDDVQQISDVPAWKVRRRLISELMQDGMDAAVACDAVSRLTILLDPSLDDVFLTQLSEQYAACLLNIWRDTYQAAKSLLQGTSDTVRIPYIANVMFLNGMWNHHLILLENQVFVD